jgi:hypothetical protein
MNTEEGKLEGDTEFENKEKFEIQEKEEMEDLKDHDENIGNIHTQCILFFINNFIFLVEEKIFEYFDDKVFKLEKNDELFWSSVDLIKMDLFYVKNEGKRNS